MFNVSSNVYDGLQQKTEQMFNVSSNVYDGLQQKLNKCSMFLRMFMMVYNKNWTNV